MRSDMYSDQRPSRVPISHFSRRLAAAKGFFFSTSSPRLTSLPRRSLPYCVFSAAGTPVSGERELRVCAARERFSFLYTIILSITTSHVCSLHTFYRNRKERATHACVLHASPGVFSHGPSGRSQPTGSSRRSARAIAVLLPPMSAHASSGPRKTVPLTAPLMAAHSDGGEGRTPTGSHVHISPSRVESTAVTRSPAGSSTWLALGL